eukprot:3935077-Pleurochrysis_carterae.AAC.1
MRAIGISALASLVEACAAVANDDLVSCAPPSVRDSSKARTSAPTQQAAHKITQTVKSGASGSALAICFCSPSAVATMPPTSVATAAARWPRSQ